MNNDERKGERPRKYLFVSRKQNAVMMFRVLAPFRLNVSEKRAVSIFNTEVATL
jgi:hypothetical protein